MGSKQIEEDLDIDSHRKGVEPEPGKGSRSLAHWQNLARVRQSLAANRDAQDQYRLNPVGYMQRFGVDMAGAIPSQGMAEGKTRLGIEPAVDGAEMQLAFCKVWGCVIVVAGAVANAAAVTNALVVANANLTANVNGVESSPPDDSAGHGGDPDAPDGGVPGGSPSPDYDSGDGGV